jgi:hypothetical protein
VLSAHAGGLKQLTAEHTKWDASTRALGLVRNPVEEEIANLLLQPVAGAAATVLEGNHQGRQSIEITVSLSPFNTPLAFTWIALLAEAESLHFLWVFMAS